MHIYDRGGFLKQISQFPDCSIELTVNRLSKKRSNNQNNYLWGCVIPLVRDRLVDLGHEVNADLTHEILKLKFNTKYLHNEEGEVVAEYGGSTTELSTTDFMIYLEKIKMWASSFLGIYIPEPNEQTELGFDNE